MKNLVLIFSVCFCLASCHTLQQVKEKHKVSSNIPVKTPAIVKERCLFRCEQIFKSCQSQCHDSCRQCQKAADKQAWKSYRAYYNRMKIQGTYRPRDWLSFRDPLQCRKVTCSCIGDLNVCTQQCGGEIKKKLRATPYCE